MTELTFKRLLCKIPSGEYYADPYEIYKMVCTKSCQNMNLFKNYYRRKEFEFMFEEKKYGFEYLTSGKVRYIGTNDLNSIIVA